MLGSRLIVVLCFGQPHFLPQGGGGQGPAGDPGPALGHELRAERLPQGILPHQPAGRPSRGGVAHRPPPSQAGRGAAGAGAAAPGAGGSPQLHPHLLDQPGSHPPRATSHPQSRYRYPD